MARRAHLAPTPSLAIAGADHAARLSTKRANEYLKHLESFVGDTVPHALVSASKLSRSNESAKPFGPDGGHGTSLLVVGRAGSGKSTFLAITKKRLAAASKHRTQVLLHVDLEPRTQTHASTFDHDRLIDEVCTDILVQAEQLYSDFDPFAYDLLRDVFAGEIRRLRSSLSPHLRGTSEEETRIDDLIQSHLRQPLTHLKAYLGFLGRRDMTATILLDNVDRGTPAFERIVFQIAQTLARNTNATIVTSLSLDFAPTGEPTSRGQLAG